MMSFKKMVIMNLSLSWTCQRDRISLIIKFRLNKNNFILKKMIMMWQVPKRSIKSQGFGYRKAIF